MADGRTIALSVDPETDNDVCTFCPHVERWDGEFLEKPICAKGHETYFRSLSNYGPIWVSDCDEGEPSAEAAARNIKMMVA